MLITRMYCISKDPATFITGSFYCICKNVFMFTFSKPSTFRIADAAFLCFYIFRKFFRYRILIISGSTGCRWLVIIFFLMAFFHVSDDLFQSLYLILLHTRAPVHVQLFSAFFYCLHRLLHVLHPRRSVLYLQDYISYSLPISLKRSAQKGLCL